MVVLDLSTNGFTLGSACSLGFGQRQRTLQDKVVQTVLSEALPSRRVLLDFDCGGFQDFYARFSLRLPHEDARALLAALEQHFQTDQRLPYFTQRQKKRHAVVYPDKTVTHFLLPGPGLVHFREITLSLPDDPAAQATVQFSGSQL